MKKRFFSLFVCTALLLSIVLSAHTAWAEPSSDGGGIYTDPETGATFIVPEGWKEAKLVEGSLGPFEVQFVTQKDSGNAFTYGSYDLWGRMSASERSGLTRSEINSAYIYEEKTFIKGFIDECHRSEIEIAADDVHLVTYGKNESIEIPAVREVLGNSVSQVIIMHIENGYVHIFMLGAVNENAVRDFQSVLNSFDAPRDDGDDLGNTYTDLDTGACFIVPDGWEVDTFNLEEAASYYQIEYTSTKDSGSSFLYGSSDLWNSISESRRSGHTRSEIDSAYIYEEWSSIESLVNLAPEQGITIDPADVHLVTYGENEFIEIPAIQEMAGIRIESSLFWHVENGYTYTFTFFGTSDQATEDFNAVLSSLQVSPAEGSGLAGGDTYTDPLSGVTFVLPEGWNEVQSNIELSYPFQVQFASQKDPGSTLLYGNVDAWIGMTESERSGHTRADIDSAYIYAYDDGMLIEYMAERFVQGSVEAGGNAEVDDIELVTYGKNECIEFSVSQEIFGAQVPFTVIMYIENGYMHTFMFGGNSEQATQDFRSVLSSLQTTPAETPDSGGTGSGQPDAMVETSKRLLTNFCLFLLELGLTFFIYALPFVIYRHAIRKRPVSEKVLVLIFVILYEFVALLLLNGAMFWFLRRYANYFIPFIWGWYSYRKMVRRKDTDDVPEDVGGSTAPQQPAAGNAPNAAPPAHSQNTPTAPERSLNGGTPAAQPPKAHTPAPAAPVSHASAPAAPQTSPAASAMPASPDTAAYIPAAPTPAQSAPQTPPPTAPVPQASPAARHSGSAAPASSLWPTKYSHAQDMRAGFPKSAASAPAYPPPVSPAPKAPSAAYIAAAPASAPPAPQTPPPAQPNGTAASTSSLWPAQYSHAQDMRAGFPKSAAKTSVDTSVPYVPAASVPAATAPAGPASAAPTPAPAAPQTSPAAAPVSQITPVAQHSGAAAPVPQVPPAPAVQASASPLPQAPSSPAEPSSASPAPQTPPTAPRIQFCRNCGFQLLEDSKFCSACGTPVVPAAKE